MLMMFVKKIIIICLSVFIFFSTSFATTYTISRNQYEKIQQINNRIVSLVGNKYPDKKKYIYQVIIDSIDGYLVLHKDISNAKKITLLCVKTFLEQKLGYKIAKPIKIYIK